MTSAEIHKEIERLQAALKVAEQAESEMGAIKEANRHLKAVQVWDTSTSKIDLDDVAGAWFIVPVDAQDVRVSVSSRDKTLRFTVLGNAVERCDDTDFIAWDWTEAGAWKEFAAWAAEQADIEARNATNA